jgi:3,4-dihydroxy 2-butanone 4-phosphate synthase/GTP cyclohydrolase II
MARRAELEAFARQHHLKMGTIADLIRYRLRNERSVERVSEQVVQTEFGEFRLVAYQDRVHGGLHVALVHGRLDGPEEPLVRVHVADTLRDLFGVRGDSRAWTLRAALERVARSGSGVVVVLREPETAKDLADALRSLTMPPVSAHGPVVDHSPANDEGGGVLRTYGIGAQILKDLGVRRMRVLSAPKQMHGISAFDLEVAGYAGEDA